MTDPAAEGETDAANRLRAVVLLSGSVGSNRLRTAVGGAILDLPIDASGATIADHWNRHVHELATRLGRTVHARIVVDQSSATPRTPSSTERVSFTVERDPKDYRGTGGVLRDIADHYDEDDLLLVANGTQIMLSPLAEQLDSLVEVGGDVSLIAHLDGTPSGVMLVRCGALRGISRAGFVDMKEQALPQIARTHDVRVVTRERPVGLPVRTLPDYILALRAHHRRRGELEATPDAFDENLSSTFAIVDGSARVDPSARVHDSVVMRGAKVMSGAALVRSVVCPGAVVARDRRVVDQLVTTGAGRSGGEGDA